MKKEILLVTEMTGLIVLPFVYILGWITTPAITALFTGIYMLCLFAINKSINRKTKLMKSFGKAKIFTGVRFDGRPMTSKDFEVVMGIFRIPMALDSDQGKIALIHGYPSYTHGFSDGKKLIGHREMSDHFPEGQHWLISCHNAFHGNYATARNSFIRPRQTVTVNPVVADFDAGTGEMICYAGSKSLNWQIVFALPILIYIFPVIKYYYGHFTEYKKYLK